MAFDGAAWLQAHREAWSVTLADPRRPHRRRSWTYEARDVSVLEVAEFRAAYTKAAGDEVRQVKHLKAFLQQLFPGAFWWRRPDPVELILALPFDGREAVLADFFRYRATRKRAPRSTTTGPASAPPSPPPAPPTTAGR